MNKFEQLGIDDAVMASINELGFTQPTQVQEKAIPLVIDGKDVIAGSATGSGKTLAFGAGIIQRIKKGAGIQALILAPTRELAQQIKDALKTFSKHKPMNIMTVYGGVSINPQIDNLPKADVVVGTPGRILDHLQRGTINLSKVKQLVLDEADRMLDMGFLDDVRNIMSHCPQDKQTLLFSATISPDIRDLSSQFMKNPVNITATPMVDPSLLKQVYYEVPGPLKFSLLTHLLSNNRSPGLVMIFCNSRQMTDFVAKNLKKNGVDALGVHGGLSQNRRTNVVGDFNKGKISVLVCTDVAARGLDIPDVSHVYNYDIPRDSKQYIHRIGRTARAGKEGMIVNLISQRDHQDFSKVIYENHFDIKRLEKPHIKKLETSAMRRDRGSSRSRDGSTRSSFRGGDRRYSSPRDRMRSGSSSSRGTSRSNSFRNRNGGNSSPRNSFGNGGSSSGRVRDSSRSGNRNSNQSHFRGNN